MAARKGALRITAIHIIIGFLWIALSDNLIFRLYGDQQTPFLHYLGIAKGFVYVILTGLLLYNLIRWHNSNLIRNEKKYRSYFEGNPDPMWVYNLKDYRFIEVNNAAIANYGYSRQEFLDMTILDIRPPEEIQKLKHHLVKLRDNDFSDSGVWTHTKKDGSVIFVQITSHIVSTGPVEKVMVMAKDTTTHVRYEQQLQTANQELNQLNNELNAKEILLKEALDRFNLVAKTTNDMLYDYDIANNRLIYSQDFAGIVNPAFYNEPDPTKAWFAIVHPDDLPAMIEANMKCLEKKWNKYECEYRVDFGFKDYRFVHDQAAIQYENGVPVRMIGAIRDITVIKEKEASLILKNKTLEDISWLESHEMRRPLASILGLMDLIKQCNDPGEKEELFEMVDVCAKELDVMVIKISKTINDEVYKNSDPDHIFWKSAS